MHSLFVYMHARHLMPAPNWVPTNNLELLLRCFQLLFSCQNLLLLQKTVGVQQPWQQDRI
jgi:hypothetical protein